MHRRPASREAAMETACVDLCELVLLLGALTATPAAEAFVASMMLKDVIFSIRELVLQLCSGPVLCIKL